MLEIRNIQKRFGSQTALSSIDLKIGKGEFFSLLGPSGCGKSTLLRILAGLETADSGEILWDGVRIDTLPARQRPFNMVFQKYALFPHISVAENIAFPLRLKKLSDSEVAAKVKDALHLVNLDGFGRRLPETLSGGQAQRVALARALVNEPSCVLLDEPLAALDQRLREHMQTELRELQKRLGLTFIFVTHDQEEAMVLSDRIAVMHAGRVEQVSEPRDLYETPLSLFCARFIGRRNEIQAEVISGGQDGGQDWVALRMESDAQIRARAICQELKDLLEKGQTAPARAFIQPEKLRVLKVGQGHGEISTGMNKLNGEVVQVLFRGGNSEVVVALNGGSQVRSTAMGGDGATSPRVGDKVQLGFSSHDLHVFMNSGEF